ncbi:MAG: uracil-DNA glycosylase [Cupriavidus sp.]|nr:uracil-DNA glycosylase [Cupriavidus sp.]
MNRRAMFLEVLGIPAEWVPRKAPVTAVAEAPLAETIVMAEASEVVKVAAMAEAAESVKSVDSTEVATPPMTADNFDTPDAGDAAEIAETVEAFDTPARAAAPAVPILRQSNPEQDGRDAAIAAMDWPTLAASVAGCTDCGLCATRTNTVFGVGDQRAEWMLVGEAPGENEDLQGEPFVGQAGKLLDNMLAALGLARDRNVYIANVLKCRPPGNRNPEPDEVAQCEPYLKRQIALIKPKVIVVLGRFAAQSLLRSTTPIGKLRGTVHTYEGIPVVVTYHPAYLLRTLTDKARAWEDLCLAREVLNRAGAQA